MRFELNPKGSQLSDADLLDDLKRVAALTGRRHVAKSDYEEHGRFNRGTFRRRFGSWKVALSQAGLAPEARPVATREALIEDLQRVATHLRKTELALLDYREHGMWSERPFVRVFGGWLQGLQAAGLKPGSSFQGRVSDRQLFENMEAVWTTLGRQPRYSEFHPPLSRYSRQTYCARFGGWRKSLEEFVHWVSAEPSEGDEAPAPMSSAIPSAAPQVQSLDVRQVRQVRRTVREVNLRLRFRVMQRDRFSCAACGRSPALVPGLALHVDHIVPWSRGGETVLTNLQTLCEACNLGKSDS